MPSSSSVQSTYLVMPTDANIHQTAFGGRIMEWMDLISGICATRYCRLPTVTVAVDELVFKRPIRVGDTVIVKASVNYAGKTSMEVGVRVEREDAITFTIEHCLSGYFTFVAIDRNGKPVPVPPVEPETDDEKRRYGQAKIRRANRLDKRTE